MTKKKFNMMRIKKIITFIVLVCVFGAWALLKYRLAHTQVDSEEARDANKTLYLYAVSDYFPESILKKFEAHCKCRIQYDYFSNNEELLAKLQAGATGYDVLVPSDFIVQALIASDLLAEIDKNKIPNLKNIAKEFLNTPFDPENKYTIAYKWGTTGFIYNTKKVTEKLDSWENVFQPKYAGRISLLDNGREALGSQLLSLGYSMNSVNDNELKKARDAIVKRKNIIKVFSGDPRQLLLSNDIWIAQVYSGDAMQVIRDRPEFRYNVAKEGGMFWIDTMAIFKNSKNVDLALDFINFMLEPEIEKINVTTLLYSSPNSLMDKENINETLKPSYIKKLDFTKLEFLKDLGVDGQKWDQIWTEVKSN